MITTQSIAYAKQIFWERLGQAYKYGGAWSPTDLKAGTDCSGLVFCILSAAVDGPGAMKWHRQGSTESWPPNSRPGAIGPYGTRCVASPQHFPPDAAMTIAIHHGGGGANSHMNCAIGGYLMEDSSSHGVCSSPQAIPQTDPYWTDWWYLPADAGTANANLPRGIDYSTGPPGGAAIKAAGYSFVCRYVFDGSPDLPKKLLTKAEADDLIANGISIVSNWESSADAALKGFDQGVKDAQVANANHLAAGGPPDRPIYFSVDWDAAEDQQPAINDYLRGAASVIGVQRVGIYGGYWPLKRALDAGVATWAWQAQAWSNNRGNLPPVGPDGYYLDPRANILQRNSAGYATVNNVQCDIDQAYTTDFGQWGGTQQGNSQLTPEERDKLFQVWGALFNPIQSKSPFRTLGEGAIWQQHELPINDDGFAHFAWMEKMAVDYKAPWAINALSVIASADPQQYPDRQSDAALARLVLARAQATNAAPPTPAPTPAPSQKTGFMYLRPIQYTKAIVTFLGGAVAVGNYVAHEFAGFLPTNWSVALSSGIAIATTISAYLVKQEPLIEKL